MFAAVDIIAAAAAVFAAVDIVAAAAVSNTAAVAAVPVGLTRKVLIALPFAYWWCCCWLASAATAASLPCCDC